VDGGLPVSADTRDLSWLGGPAPAPPVYPESIIWRVEKDTRWAEARIRQVPHGHELRFVVGGAGRDETLMQSTVYRDGQSDELGGMTRGTLDNFLGHGWIVAQEPGRPE
jgi:hypothetical protein